MAPVYRALPVFLKAPLFSVACLTSASAYLSAALGSAWSNPGVSSNLCCESRDLQLQRRARCAAIALGAIAGQSVLLYIIWGSGVSKEGLSTRKQAPTSSCSSVYVKLNKQSAKCRSATSGTDSDSSGSDNKAVVATAAVARTLRDRWI
eukprot:7380-Heterococcus_DN1.PRE.1